MYQVSIHIIVSLVLLGDYGNRKYISKRHIKQHKNDKLALSLPSTNFSIY